MNILARKEKTRYQHSPFRKCQHSYLRKCALLLLCVAGITASLPAHAQDKPKTAPKPSISWDVPYGYSQVGNTRIYYNQFSNIDIQGYFDGAYYGSTYSNGGYRVAMQVNDNWPVTVDCNSGSDFAGVHFAATVQQQGELARICYTVTNNNEEDVTVSLGTHADVMIGGNDRAPISRRIDTTGSTYGVTMADGGGAQLCVLFGAGLAGVTSVSDFWFGYYGSNRSEYEMVGNYNAGSDFMVENGSYDSGMGWCWKNRTIPAGASVEFAYLIGVGEVNLEPNSSFEVTSDDPEGWNDLSRPHKLCLEGTYESPAGLDGMIEYAVEDSEEWLPLTEMMPSGSNFSDSLVAMFDASRDKHVIRFRTKDNVGNTTLLPSIEYLDVSFHEYSGVQNYTYTGDSIYQTLECTDKSDLQFTTGRYYNNVNAGTASFCVEGVFPYTIGRKQYWFDINPAPLAGDIVLERDHYTYEIDGFDFHPSFTFTDQSMDSLVIDRDYSVYYYDNRYAGTATVKVSGINNYTSELTKTFTIERAPFREGLLSLWMPNEDITYDGREHSPNYSRQDGVGDIIFSYVRHDIANTSADDPGVEVEAAIEEGRYDVYYEVLDGDGYYGKPKEYLGTFTIYNFDETEWMALSSLRSELTAMGFEPNWNLEGGITEVNNIWEIAVEQGHVKSFTMGYPDMTGVFPASLALFTQIEEIRILGCSLSGDLPLAIATIKRMTPEAFSNLKKLDIRNNYYSGNLGILGMSLPNLTHLEASFNKFEDIFPALPETVTYLDISNQNMDRIVDLNMSNLSVAELATKIPTILLYNHSTRNYDKSVNLLFSQTGEWPNYDQWGVVFSYDNGQMSVGNASGNNAYRGESGDTLCAKSVYAYENSSFRIALSFDRGDANFLNGIDATDLQATVLYAFGMYNDYPFNFTAADTYRDSLINVQDVVCTVDLLLASEAEDSTEVESSRLRKVEPRAGNVTDTDAYIYLSDGKVFLHSSVPVASMSVKARGDVRWSVAETGLEQSTANGNMVAYSLSGKTMPCGEDILLGEYTHATILSVSLSDAYAQPISVGIVGESSATAVRNISDATADGSRIYDVAGYGRDNIVNGINIIRSNGTTKKIHQK